MAVTQTASTDEQQRERSGNYYLKPSVQKGVPFHFAGETRTPDGAVDYGYFGPGSLAWQVLSPATVAMLIDGPAAALELIHRGLLSVVLEHDPINDEDARRKRRRLAGTPVEARRSPREVLDRHIRTGLVPTPIIVGDTPTAAFTAKRLHAYHKPMKSVVPGSPGGPEDHYDAASAKMMLFAHVTICHAGLRLYEGVVARDGRLPRRFSPGQRDQYWREMVAFAELMGVPREIVPDSAQAVADYYAGIAHEYRDVPLRAFLSRTAQNRGLYLSTFRLANLPDTLRMLALVGVVMPVTLAVIPRPVRRILNIPRFLDPAFNALKVPFGLLLWPLQKNPALGERTAQLIFGSEAGGALRMLREAREAAARTKAAAPVATV
ncbi:MAG: oxygenase MpaB family protein [Segniliparus sp.]|uniref:oxygenase MpaB family protein n=1 Tax=Segniliparus sp. TaxID=2804064 RepID=UPI003F2FD1F6